MKKFWVAAVCAALLLTGCGPKVNEAGPKPDGRAKEFRNLVSIKVTKRGEVFCNKKAISVDELGSELNRHPKDDTAVCYYREEGDKDAPPVAVEVIQKITDARLAVHLSRVECP
ncbi:MAG: hypothetical protein H0T60_10725 [Acidobacteria bacterium]|nr:hypothetical protein [Acidobacteriota bacterium]